MLQIGLLCGDKRSIRRLKAMKTFLYPVLGLVLAGAGCSRTPSSVDAAGLPGAAPGPEPRLGYAEVTGNSAATPALARTAQGYATGSAAEIPSGTVVHVRLL